MPAGDCIGVPEGETAGRAGWDPGVAAGVADAPGCVPGCAPGGFAAAAGWLRFSESFPSTAFALGVPLGVGEAAGIADGCAAPVWVAVDCGLAAGDCSAAGGGDSIGFAGAGVFCANPTTVSSIARPIGIRAIPLLLSTQA